uniref:ILEI domain-containing protein n=1 Tax=Syphacia muris TaxID=451379 RepID=A0A158R485_9BILA
NFYIAYYTYIYISSSTVYACSIGLTQLRYRSLQLMYCIPPSNSNESDPCPQFVNGQKALCQKDEAEGQYICCGAPELLIDLLSSKEVPQKVQVISVTFAVQNSAPILSLITNPYYATGNINNTWTTTSIVVLVQDGPCSIVINTGLPIQKNEIVANLAAKGIVANKLDYTVITSGFPQFIGNANLFPTSQFITPFVNLCSSKTQIMRTPGPSPDSISVIVRNVPMMGTVAITGALFVQDIDVNRIDSAFVWDTNELYTSRRKVICISDWIIPGHSAPVQVTEIHKRQAQCPEIYN